MIISAYSKTALSVQEKGTRSRVFANDFWSRSFLVINYGKFPDHRISFHPAHQYQKCEKIYQIIIFNHFSDFSVFLKSKRLFRKQTYLAMMFGAFYGVLRFYLSRYGQNFNMTIIITMTCLKVKLKGNDLV